MHDEDRESALTRLNHEKRTQSATGLPLPEAVEHRRQYLAGIADCPLGEAVSGLIELASPPRARTGRLPETSEI